jgi:hypothetical protein
MTSFLRIYSAERLSTARSCCGQTQHTGVWELMTAAQRKKDEVTELWPQLVGGRHKPRSVVFYLHVTSFPFQDTRHLALTQR